MPIFSKKFKTLFVNKSTIFSFDQPSVIGEHDSKTPKLSVRFEEKWYLNLQQIIRFQ